MSGGVRGWWNRRWVRVTAIVTAVIVAIGIVQVIVIYQDVRSPGVDPIPDDADAIVVFAGQSDRLAAGLFLARQDVAPVLVISLGEAVDGFELCDGTHSLDIRCVRPESINTRGEAQAFGQLADAEGWTSLVAVTDGYHVERARIYLERCFDGDVSFVGVNRSEATSSKINHEVLGTLQAKFLVRGC